jgi:L,D-transpeptidase ErfK/SrfK
MYFRLIGWLALLTIGLVPSLAFSTTYPMPRSGNDVVGENYTVRTQPGDTLASLGLRYGMSLHKILEANPTIRDADRLLGAGRKILIPAQIILPPFRKGIVVNLAELRLYYFTPDGKYVMTFPVAMGRDEWRTPTTFTKVVYKETDPVWHVPESIREYTIENTGEVLPDEVQPGPENPLGHYALHLGAPGYLIHGNNNAKSIGRFVSSGCIRMKNADIETLFNLVKLGTQVYIIHYPNKVGWHDGVLYQESQIPVSLSEEPSYLNQTSLENVIDQGLHNKAAVIDWKTAEEVEGQHLGIPEPIGHLVSRQADAEENMNTDPPPSSISEDQPANLTATETHHMHIEPDTNWEAEP